jgi:hypothetical protein
MNIGGVGIEIETFWWIVLGAWMGLSSDIYIYTKT